MQTKDYLKCRRCIGDTLGIFSDITKETTTSDPSSRTSGWPGTRKGLVISVFLMTPGWLVEILRSCRSLCDWWLDCSSYTDKRESNIPPQDFMPGVLPTTTLPFSWAWDWPTVCWIAYSAARWVTVKESDGVSFLKLSENPCVFSWIMWTMLGLS